jgi:2-polyprenyl-3-methyl-5-hydroxy-6-metoxy-1,4-benzoquinol methylase
MNSPYTCNPTTGVFERPDREFFAYSDGQEMEAGMLESLRKIRDRSVFSHEVRALRKNWTTKYHFSPLRGNLLRPFADELRGADVLEMGAGCGAVTRFMGEAGARVVAVEGSAMRAAIIAKRCEDLPNVRVIADNFQDFETDQRFDFVTLIGVLEYSRHFIKAEDPVMAALQLARAFLKPGGSLLIAIENQLGLKYFNGAPEDHMGQFAFGLNDSYSRDSVVTFGREEL